MPATIPQTALEALADVGVVLTQGSGYSEARQQFARAFANHAKEFATALPRSATELIEPFLWDRLWRNRNVAQAALWLVVHQRLGDTRAPQDVAESYYKMPVAERTKWHAEIAAEMPDVVRSIFLSVISSGTDEAESLPWTYDVFAYVPIQHLAEYVGDGVELRGGRLGRVSEADKKAYDPDSLELLDDETGNPYEPQWSDGYYLNLEVTGYIVEDPNVSDRIVANVRDHLESILGLFVACGLLNIDQNPNARWEPPEAILVFRRDEPRNGRVLWFPDDEDNVLRRIVAALPEGDGGAYARRMCHAIAAALRRRDDRLLNAARWLFGSYFGSNELLRLVQATVAFEILLGDKRESDDVGIAKLLANRAAYMLGTSAARREELLAEIKKIYNARSRIVHSGRNDLGGDADTLVRMQSICKLVLQKELSIFELVE